MTNPIGDPEAVEDLARRFRDEASRIESGYSSSQARLDETIWVGTRATRTRDGFSDRQIRVTGLIEDLQAMATDLDGHAAWMRATIHELQQLEHHIRRWASAHPSVPGAPWPNASIIGQWPPQCDLSWRFLASRLRAAGAVF